MKRPKAPAGATVAERLAYHSIPEPNSGCLLWLGAVCSEGYGHMRIEDKMRGVHRVALELKLGRPLESEEEACHKCDVTTCIAENHLFPGTHADNMADMAAKGRSNAWGIKSRSPQEK